MVPMTLITQKWNKKAKVVEFSHVALIIINMNVVLLKLGFQLILGLSLENFPFVLDC